jgi:dolichol-phosphate mannosyltransferase
MLSIVIPVYNERESLDPLFAEIQAMAGAEKLDLEIIFVDDGSKDGSWEVIRELADKHPEAHGIRFRRNFGKAAALAAGFGRVRGNIVMTLDADLQDDPKEVPRFLKALEGVGVGEAVNPPRPLDVISGWKRIRHDPWHKVGPSRIFNWLVSYLTGVRLHDHNCGMKAYRVEVLREIRLYGELHRFIPVLADARGFRVGEIVINHRPRRFGRSKYGVRRFIKGFLDLLTVKFLTDYSKRPQHILGSLGLVSFLLGSLGMTCLAVIWLINNLWFRHLPESERPFLPLHERPLLIYSVAALLLGAQMMTIGFLAELITAYQTKDEDTYSIAEQTSRPTH